MNEKVRKMEQLTEVYEKERRIIEQKIETAEAQLHSFRRETEAIFDEVVYLTREDSIDVSALNWELTAIDDGLRQEGKRYCEKLDEEQNKLRNTFHQSMEQIEEEYRKEMKKQEDTID